MNLGFRTINLAGAAICLGAIAFAYFWLELGLGLEPCPLCVLDRVVFAAAAVVFAAAALHSPGRLGRRLYAGTTLIVLLAGVAIGVRHVWLQQLPADQVPACGPDIAYMFDVFPALDALQMIFQGSGSCAEIDVMFLGLSLAGWTLVLFLLLAALAAWQLVRPARR